MGETGASLVFGAITRGKNIIQSQKGNEKKKEGDKNGQKNAFLALSRNSVWEERVQRSATDEVL